MIVEAEIIVEAEFKRAAELPHVLGALTQFA
jgi:hypothetical protein